MSARTKKRRLNREIAVLKEHLIAAKMELSYNPYKQDHPGIRKSIAELKEDLTDAKLELRSEELMERMANIKP